MICQYGFYKEDEKKPRLYCKLNKQFCIYSKYCGNEKRYIHTERYKECYIMNEQNNQTIPQGACRVIMIKRGVVFVEIEPDHLVQTPETIEGITNYVYIKRIGGNQFEISLTPFVDEKPQENKRKTTRKTK